jgi:hypothetical protein
MLQALGYRDLISAGRCGQAAMPARNPGCGATGSNRAGVAVQGAIEVRISSTAVQLAYTQKIEVQLALPQSVAQIARPAAAQSMQSPETSAHNILNFVEDRLASLKAAGASPEQLQKTLDDGLKGFETGRDQAIDILKGYGMYDGPIKAGVEKTTELVKQGVEELAKAYLPAAQAPAAGAAPAPATPTEAVKSGGTVAAPATSGSNTVLPSVNRYRASFSTGQTLDLTVQTRDGDTIRISIQSLQKLRVSGAQWNGMTGFAGLQGNGTLESFRGLYSESMLFEVDGELDDAEKAALDDLLVSIMDLADSFYGGDMAAAMDKAMQLAFDPQELTSMALNMTQTRYMRASAASYHDIAGLGAGAAGERRASRPVLTGLGDYVKRLLHTAEKASGMKNPQQFINELFSARFAQRDAMQPRHGPMKLEHIDALHRQLVEAAMSQLRKAQ